MDDPENWEYITSVEYVGGRKDVLPNMLILSGNNTKKNTLKRTILKTGLVPFNPKIVI